ncbi:MAG: threonyl-tRNA synthetase [Candidatus Methanomethylophilaceae archaeon]|nr:threonyl-tRNA synthetase [Candidatus Methanomethylophilaceae archaeon]
MRVLYIHADFMEFESKKKTPAAEDVPAQMHNGRMEEVLVVFITVESSDKDSFDELSNEAVQDIVETAKKVGAERVMLYPYAHLSNDLAPPKDAINILRAIEEGVATSGMEVARAPFGWYKAFHIRCKGHPLSELSRDFKGRPSKEERRAEGTFIILTPEGEEIAVEDYKGGSECFREMVDKEALKKEGMVISEEPKYLRLCRKFGIQWEAMSDVGHMAFNPGGALMFDLVADYATAIVNDLDLPIYMVKGTNMFSLDEEPVREHAELFGDRLYTVDTGKQRFVLRYAACHQQFAMMRNWNISYRHLPFGAFEVADSYRLEQSGETMLCFRTRRLNMPDLHVLCRDMPEAQERFVALDERIVAEMAALGREYELLINLSSKQAYEDNKDMILRLLEKHQRPALLHFYPEGTNYYWTINIEYHILDQMKRAREIGTVQIDVGNAKRFGITYAGKEAERHYPIILHTAVIGTIERYLYTLFDSAVQIESEGKVGYLPTWITPEQIRLLPVSGSHVERASEIADRLESFGIRVSIDDSDSTVGKKVRRAKQDWCSYVAVIGDKELSSGVLNVYVRSSDSDEKMTADALGERIAAEIKGKPFRRMYMPRELSRRVDF